MTTPKEKRRPSPIALAVRLESSVTSNIKLNPVSPDDALRLTPSQIADKYRLDLSTASQIHSEAESALDRIAAG